MERYIGVDPAFHRDICTVFEVRNGHLVELCAVLYESVPLTLLKKRARYVEQQVEAMAVLAIDLLNHDDDLPDVPLNERGFGT